MAGNSTNMPPPQDRTKLLLSGFTKALNAHFSVPDSASTTSLLPVCHKSECTPCQLQVQCNIPFPSLPYRLRLHTTPTADPPGTNWDCNVRGEFNVKPHTSRHHFLLRQSRAQCPALPHLWHTSVVFFFQDCCSQELPAALLAAHFGLSQCPASA